MDNIAAASALFSWKHAELRFQCCLYRTTLQHVVGPCPCQSPSTTRMIQGLALSLTCEHVPVWSQVTAVHQPCSALLCSVQHISASALGISWCHLKFGQVLPELNAYSSCLRMQFCYCNFLRFFLFVFFLSFCNSWLWHRW